MIIENRIAINFRNLLILKKYLNSTALYDSYDVAKNIKQKFDVFIFGFGSSTNEFNQTVKLLNNNPNAKIFWMVGEYEQTNYWAILKAKRRFSIIKNFDGDGRFARREWIDNEYFLNINLLIARQSNKLTQKKYDCIYYSRWRPGRKKYLIEYLKNGIYFSSDSKNFKQHSHIGCNPRWIKKLSWTYTKETLNNFRYSLYIEDEYSHNVFNNLANRWYEAGFCNVVMFFDVNCWNTIMKSEIGKYKEQVENYIVYNYKTLEGKIKLCNNDFQKHLYIQKEWRKNELILKEEMLEKVKSIVTS